MDIVIVIGIFGFGGLCWSFLSCVRVVIFLVFWSCVVWWRRFWWLLFRRFMFMVF